MRGNEAATVAQLDSFDEVIDVRSPSEYAEDHIPRAASHPVLDDDERALIGTLHQQASAFAAKKRGAALVARNIATHIEREFQHRGADWRPLIYCWRGGKRSRSLALVLREIGWRAAQLDGGYKAFRRTVLDDLTTLPPTLRFIVVCGETGSAKSRVLGALDAHGAQVLDLEALAVHRGSVLGEHPHALQPAQKWFETQIWDRLRRFNAAQPVFVESESKKIGQVQIPDALITAMRAGRCVRLDVPIEARARYLVTEYPHWMSDPSALVARLDHLRPLHGGEMVDRWRAQVTAGDWPAFVGDMLANHYDPAYRRSMARNFACLADAAVIQSVALDAAGIAAVATGVLAATTY